VSVGGERGILRLLLEAVEGLGPEAVRAVGEVVGLHREFPAWGIWLPAGSRPWTAVRLASGRCPGPGLPMVWVHAPTSAELADRMRRVDGQLAG
jgi:hypothetical protein